ncbi:hypothetical protein, partial [Streptomyces hygroscopicus]|uniref:hypothetical protein n=1 Tax=Streptomyces hygroscopicus TaxID=1912 RepID=UPI0033FA1046
DGTDPAPATGASFRVNATTTWGPTRALLGQARTSAQIATVRNHRHRTGRGSADVLKCRPRRGTGSPRGAGGRE